MIEYHFNDKEYNDVIKETEEIKLDRMEEEAKKARERDDAIRTFEGLSHRLESGKTWFDIPPPHLVKDIIQIVMAIVDVKKTEIVEILPKRKRKREKS